MLEESYLKFLACSMHGKKLLTPVEHVRVPEMKNLERMELHFAATLCLLQLQCGNVANNLIQATEWES